MSEKYIDLVDALEDELEPTLAGPGYISNALKWLDENPDQVPGRRVSRRDFERAFDFHFDDEDIDRHERFLTHLGITVVPDPDPDPEPTNAEKLEIKLRALALEVSVSEHQLELARSSAPELAAWLDEHGVRAGGDDDQ